eukprot:gnl/Trimastix_PCT/3330.p1 GENE.gnl/Trimastix_PCT/3330~~gnl/Trimastix_PCT/3330.p1  ORF type:complete len:134 (+),score=35.07 gnl/Trimastix_PCT/3330:153-554(+)
MSGLPAEPRLFHACIRVADIDRSKEWYTKVLGLREVHRINVENKPGLPDCTLVFLQNDSSTYQIELKQLKNDATPVDQGSAFDHFGFHVADLQAERARLAELGLEPTDLLLGGKIFFVRDPDGYGIELVQARA